jgi:hypothetical protein
MPLKLDRRWVVRNRTKTMHRMLKLDELGPLVERHPDAKRLWKVYGMLVGVIFSLWRAVILIGLDRNLEKEFSHGRKLLGILIDTNAIGFPQDRETADWNAAYYVNNATMRLHILGDILYTRHVLSERGRSVLGNFDPGPMMMIEQMGVELARVWENALMAFDVAFQDLKRASQHQTKE